MQIEIKTEGINKIEKYLGSMQYRAKDVLYNTLKRVASNIRKNISVETRKKYIIKADDVKKTLKFKGLKKADLTFVASSSGETVPLYKFRVKPQDVVKLKGIKREGGNYPQRQRYKAKVIKKSSLKALPHSFVMKMPNGHIGLFKRKIVSNELKKILKKRDFSEIYEMKGPSVPQMIANDEVMRKIQQDAEKTYNTRLEHELNRVLGRL